MLRRSREVPFRASMCHIACGVQAAADERALVARSFSTVLQSLADAVSSRWAKLVTAAFGSSLEAYAQGSAAEPPLTLAVPEHS